MTMASAVRVDLPGAPEALRRIASASPPQLAAGGVLALVLLLLALQLRAYTWAAMFAALLLPLGATMLALLAMQRNWQAGRGWPALARGLLVLVPLSSWAAARIYHAALDWAGIAAQNQWQVAACCAALELLLLALPLAIAHNAARALHLAQLSQSAMVSDLKALQAQIEPHFLYNTLANTRYLVRHDPARALAMLDHLIAYLRSALPDLRSAMSTLGRECELAEHYLELMAIRYGDRLRIAIDCPPGLRALELPPLMLMPLVENAVQHGMEPHAGEVSVQVQARQDGGRLLVTVRDNGAGVGAAVLGSGVGLRNLRQRLEALHGAAASVRLRVAEDGWTEAVISLPAAVSKQQDPQ
jgi:signal transduction histidine kinase